MYKLIIYQRWKQIYILKNRKICHSALKPLFFAYKPQTLQRHQPLYSHKEQKGIWEAQTTAMTPKVTCQAEEWAQT